MAEFEPLHPLFGVEVRGVDLTRPVGDAEFDVIRDALDRHSLLVFRDQPIDDEQQLAFSRRFGRLFATRKGAIGEGQELVVLTNLDADGNIMPASAKHVIDGRANQLWHSDASFRPVPAYASVLTGRRVASEGGETEFASTRVAYRKLDAATRRRVDGLETIHDFAHSRAQVDPHLLSAEQRAELPPVRHPLVRHHSATGEPALFLGSHVREVIGLGAAEGRALIDELTAAATGPDRVHAHRWRPGDLLVWDNSAVMHRGRPWRDSDEPRHMVRATVADDGYSAGALAAA